jgi:hypothetical protein
VRKLMLALMVLMLIVLVQPAWAITYGQLDGNLHPNVGALVGDFGGQMFAYCSGTLISPTVFLTAAHCNLGTSTVYVTFDSIYTPAEATLYAGTFHADPLFSQRQNDPHDIAVVVFDTPISGLTPALLPAPGQFNQMGHGQTFTAVGYGGQETINQPGGPVNAYLNRREFSVPTFNAVAPGYLRLSQNPARGNGGTCYGDSGGPNFLGADEDETNVIAGITITGDMLCKATNVIYRLDTESARAFLSPFVTLP